MPLILVVAGVPGVRLGLDLCPVQSVDQLGIRPCAVLVEQAVQRLLVDPGLGELDLGVLPVGGVDDGGAADLGDLDPVAVEAPAADLARSDDVLDEEDTVGEPETELVKELDVLEDVVVRGACVGVFVVVPVDEQLDDGLLGVGGYQGLELNLIVHAKSHDILK